MVVFLAGHTDVLQDASGRERFSLLLPVATAKFAQQLAAKLEEITVP